MTKVITYLFTLLFVEQGWLEEKQNTTSKTFKKKIHRIKIGILGCSFMRFNVSYMRDFKD